MANAAAALAENVDQNGALKFRGRLNQARDCGAGLEPETKLQRESEPVAPSKEEAASALLDEDRQLRLRPEPERAKVCNPAPTAPSAEEVLETLLDEDGSFGCNGGTRSLRRIASYDSQTAQATFELGVDEDTIHDIDDADIKTAASKW